MTSDIDIQVFNEIKRRSLKKSELLNLIDAEFFLPEAPNPEVENAFHWLYEMGYVVIPLAKYNDKVVPPRSQYYNKKDVFGAITDTQREIKGK